MSNVKTIEEIYEDGFISKETEIKTDFKVGDEVIYTNRYGVEFEVVVFGFSVPYDDWSRGYGIEEDIKFIHTHPKGKRDNFSGVAWWFPHPNKDFRKK